MGDFITLGGGGGGERLYLDEYGEAGDRPALVCLHGLGGGGYFFAGVGRSLAASGGGHVLCPDLPGSGCSPRGDQALTFDRFPDAAVQLIAQKIPAGPVVLMGHSMGTIIALRVYARIPERIRSMIFVGGLPAPLPEAQARLRNRAALARSAGMAAVAQSIVPVVFARRSLAAIPDEVAMFQRLLAQSDPEGYAQTALAVAAASATEVVEHVRVPCLCVTGTEDRYAPAAAVRPFADSLPGAVYRELLHCGHMPFFEASDRFNYLVETFLSEAELSRR